MNQEIRNKLRNVVTQCRRLLEDSVSMELEGKYAIFSKKDQVIADPNAKMTHLTEDENEARKDIFDHFGHIKARGFKPKEALDQLVREIAFTHLNRLCAYKMMEAREVYIGDQKFREAVSRGFNSNGMKFYLADHPEEERLFNTGHQDIAYRHFLDWLGGFLSDEIGTLFNPNDPANRLYPRQKTLDAVLDLLNGGGIKPEETELREEWPKIWLQDETIGWVYQYFTPKELRDQARKESQAPRNSYELAFRNQFFTPRYVVEFLTDNTLGRIWYEMRKGDTKLTDQCRYMVRRPVEIFLKEGEQPPKESSEGRDNLSQEELLQLPVFIPHRAKKDPRELRILDPASGSGHFLLYCFDLLLTIYEEAYADPDLGPALHRDYPKLEDLQRHVPRLILAHNVHGIDIDLRASQIAALALWLRCQRAYQEMGLKRDRPKITRSNFVCAEPMPGEEEMLTEFVGQLERKFLGQVVEVVFEKMKLAGEAGSLLKIEEEIRGSVSAAKKQWIQETTKATDRKGQPLLFTQAMMDRLAGKPEQPSMFDLSDITDDQFFEQAEAKVIDVLRDYSEKAQNGQKLRRRLFAHDAVQGFAFVDLCQKRYDVLLMNPPFGDPAERTRSMMNQSYGPLKNELMACFVSRGHSLLETRGRIGGILSRTLLFNSFCEDIRRVVFSDTGYLACVADLGYGVLDEALVETACIVAERGDTPTLESLFLKLLKDGNKEAMLPSLVDDARKGRTSTKLFWRKTTDFAHIFRFPMAYWLPDSLLNAFRNLPPLEPKYGLVRVGLSTADNFRFLRLGWEVPPSALGATAAQTHQGRYWVALPKGGEYEPYYDDIHLVINWKNEGAEVREYEGSTIRSSGNYFQLGTTFPYRTTSAFCVRVLPAGCIFSDGGQAILPADGTKQLSCGIIAYFNTRIARQFLEVFLGEGDAVVSGSAARNYIPRAVGAVPVPTNLPSLYSHPAISACMAVAVSHALSDETSRLFKVPRTISAGGNSLKATSESAFQAYEDAVLNALETTLDLEMLIAANMGLSEDELDVIDEEFGAHPMTFGPTQSCDEEIRKLSIMSMEALVDHVMEKLGAARVITKKMYYADRRIELIARCVNGNPRDVVASRRRLGLGDPTRLHEDATCIVSYAVGLSLGRWDIRFAMGNRQLGELPDLFDTLPSCSPGMLQSLDGIPLTINPTGYPLRINWNGILTDELGHADDIVRNVRDVIELIWKDRADAIEKEACEILCVKELRDYFRKPAKDGFWEHHLSRYSKSRRSAPIYWLLQSSKKNYSLWLYYHRLDKDLLFKALVNYVEPKIRLETSRLETLRSQLAVAGEFGKEAKRLAKDAERHEDFLSELRDFDDKLRRAANLRLEPDLDDGVVLNIAPLHELVPWQDAESYWEELLEGKYEWSSISKQLRQKGLVK